MSYLWARSLAKGLRLTRERRFGWAQVGDRLEERFTLYNDGWAPALWIEILDHSTLPEYHVSRATGLGRGSQTHWITRGLCTQRGLFTLGPTTLRSGDPFAFYTVTLPCLASDSLMVLPPIVPLPAIRVAPGGRSGEGRPRPYTLERTTTASTVRPYTPGDSPRWIHWPTTAHQGAPFVRLFDGAPTGDWWIVLDMDQTVQVGAGQVSTEEHGIILAASLAELGLRAGRSVGLVAQGETLLWLPPQAGATQRFKILQALALLRPGTCPLAEVLEGARAALGRQASLLLITAAAEGQWLATLLPLRQRGMVPTVLLLEPLSFGGTISPNVTLARLGEQGISHHLIPRDLLDRPEARPGAQGHWAWRVLASGRVIATQRPDEAEWRELR
ncbi:MAG: DUF58 domain-containing protein [Ardenticatenales bacterium]|nr:DUF58 domain-containing protein [Ardenticatenales bacterium]